MKTASILPLRPKMLISMADMIEFFAAGLAHNWQWLKAQRGIFYKKAVESPDGKPTQHEIHNLKAMLKTHNAPIGRESIKGWMFYCEQLEMEKSKSNINHFFMLLSSSNSIPNFSVIDSQLLGIENSIWSELFERKFNFIPIGKVPFFEHRDLFGVSVWIAFPSARDEIKAAGNCMAMDLNTAAVFHFMRTAEFGLKKLAKKLRVKIKHDLDLADWGEILKGVKKTLDELELKKRTPKNEKQLAFYHSILEDLKGIKHLWRNPVMHARGNYNANDALSVFTRVKDLMQRLAN